MMSRIATHDSDLGPMSRQQLVDTVLRIRTDIRWHRDMRGDDRCWLDDIKVYGNLPEFANPYTKRVPPVGEFMRLCEAFQRNRQAPNENVTEAEAARPKEVDQDVAGMDDGRLRDEIMTLRTGLRRHKQWGENRSFSDDAALYELLPEKTKAITALPQELLVNCRRFCELKLSQHPPKLHEW